MTFLSCGFWSSAARCICTALFRRPPRASLFVLDQAAKEFRSVGEEAGE